MRYDRKEAEARFGHLYETVPGEDCHYCGLPSDGYDHQPAIFTLHKFAKGRKVTRREIENNFGPCRLVPCCTICNMGLGSFEAADDNQRREEILGFLDFYDDVGERKGYWNFGAFCIACEIINARNEGILGDEIYAIPAVGRAIMTQALRSKMGQFSDDGSWDVHRQRFADWLRAEPRRKAKHFLDMARLESYDFKKGIYGRS